jgi:Domain of unknown function (DUF1905)
MFQAPLWEHDGPGSWHFVTVPNDLADAVLEQVEGRGSAFGSVPVLATIGTTTWRTSLFPDRRARSYVLPVKKSVRTAEGLTAGDMTSVDLEVLPPPD